MISRIKESVKLSGFGCDLWGVLNLLGQSLLAISSVFIHDLVLNGVCVPGSVSFFLLIKFLGI